ncbi:hypothetical protein GCM10008024_01700 [Allgaiera indica]|uniref:Uncharacterized protein n=1 Tax=Allgaiera indica TaxID=765699 RepID=A0AAN4UNH7_9RHOB|nr:hypothetical protein GCM10008024_01700 [Allgaiera indica]
MARKAIGIGGGAMMAGIGADRYARHHGQTLTLGQKDDPVGALRDQPFEQLAVLARIILMDE